MSQVHPVHIRRLEEDADEYTDLSTSLIAKMRFEEYALECFLFACTRCMFLFVVSLQTLKFSKHTSFFIAN
jgi:hypothetical protein